MQRRIIDDRRVGANLVFARAGSNNFNALHRGAITRIAPTIAMPTIDSIGNMDLLPMNNALP
jgi:hypothetical protein